MTGSDPRHGERDSPVDASGLLADDWHTVTHHAVMVLREELADHRLREPDDAEVARAASRLRRKLALGDPDARWMLEASWLTSDLQLGGQPVHDEDLIWELVAASIEPQETTDLDPVLVDLVADISPTSWIRAVVGLVRAGAGSRADAEAIVDHVRSSPPPEARHADTSGASSDIPDDADDADEADLDRLAESFDRLVPAWHAAGVIDDQGMLTRLGAWLLPRVLADAWGFDFDHDDVDDPDLEERALRLLALLEAAGIDLEDIEQGRISLDSLDLDALDLDALDLDALDLDALGVEDLDLDDPFLDGTGADEEDEEEQARIAVIAELINGFEAWVQQERITADPEEVHELLSLRNAYLDDQPTRWTLGDLHELFTEIAPPKLSIPARDIVPLMQNLALFVQFLDSQGRLAEGSDDLDPLVAWLEQSQDVVVAAMDDPSRWGPAKKLMTAALADGVEPGDTEALQGWIQEFNQRPFEERGAVIGRPGPAADLPTQMLANEAELAALVRETPIFRQLVGLLTYIGERLPLTSAGNLKLADARKLSRELGTERIAGATGKTADLLEEAAEPLRSSRDLLGLRALVDIALDLGLVASDGRSLVRVSERVAQLHEDPLAFWHELLDAWVPSGVLESPFGDPFWVHQLNLGVLHILILLLEAEHEVPIEVLLDLMLEQPGLEEHSHAAPTVAALSRDVYRFVTRLVTLGLLEVRGVRRDEDVLGIGPSGGTVMTTPLTVALLHEVADLPVHQAGSLRDAPATALLELVGELPETAARQEMEQWLAARSLPEALASLSEAACTSRPNALKAFAVFHLLDVNEVADTIESLASDATAGSFAHAWLVSHGRRELTDSHDAGRDAILTMLATLADLAGPAAIVEGFVQLGDEQEQLRFLADAWRCTLPEAEVVLTAIGDLHTSKTVRKAGRKAAFKHRSAT